MKYIKRKVESQKALFFDLLQIADKFQGEDIINNSVLLFFENGQEIISNGEKRKHIIRLWIFWKTMRL